MGIPAYERLTSPSKADIQSKVSFLATTDPKRDVSGDEKLFECQYEVNRILREDKKGVDVDVVRLDCAAA